MIAANDLVSLTELASIGDDHDEGEYSDGCDCSECVATREEWAEMNRQHERMTRG